MLQPNRVKYRRPHSLRYEGKAKGGTEVSFGDYGLMAMEGTYITDHQIEAVRIVLSRSTNRAGKVWIRIFPHMAKTKKPAEVRMGSGKGSPEGWVAVVKAGTVMFEIGGIPAEAAVHALKLAAYKLPIHCKIVKSKKLIAKEAAEKEAAKAKEAE